MEDLFELFEEYISNRIVPFVVYCKPGSTTVTALFQSHPGASYRGFTSASKGFVFAPFNGEDTFFIPGDAAYIVTQQYDSSEIQLAVPAQPGIDALAKANFEALVAKSIAAIKDGAFEKLVCSRTESVKVEAMDVAATFKRMLHAYPNAFRYCFYDPAYGLWMGATPEQLLKADGDTIHTVALAGTQLYKQGKDAVWPEKEQQEQRFVTDYIVNELQGHVDDVNVTAPYTFRAGNIIHIKTDITATLKDTANLKDVIDTLHPTPAVCGLPKAEAMEFLLENEGYDREHYSGFLGELNGDFAAGEEGKTDLFVNLRCMKVEKDEAHIFVGCGVTKDSDPEKEFIETVNKSMTMRRVL